MEASAAHNHKRFCGSCQSFEPVEGGARKGPKKQYWRCAKCVEIVRKRNERRMNHE